MSVQYRKLDNNMVLEYNLDSGYSHIINLDSFQTEIEMYQARLADIASLQVQYSYIDFEPELIALNAHIARYNLLKEVA